MQWGVAVGKNRAPVIFHLPYNQVFTATSSTDYATTNALSQLTNTQFNTTINADAGDARFRWMAIGK